MPEVERDAARASEYHLCRVTVSGVQVLGPNLRRLTLTGQGVADMPTAGPDQRLKLLLNDDTSRLPSDRGAFSITRFMGLMVSSAVRGTTIRTYTIRSHRLEAGEIDIDFALHEHGGPATRLAATAQVGDQVAVYGPACEYQPSADDAWLLLAGDDTALPAIAAILESLPSTAVGQALIEVRDRGDVQTLDSPAGVQVDWLIRDTTPAHRSNALAGAVAQLAIPDGRRWVWLAGEAGVTTGLRRHLVTDRGLDKSEVRFTGYWKHGRTDPRP